MSSELGGRICNESMLDSGVTPGFLPASMSRRMASDLAFSSSIVSLIADRNGLDSHTDRSARTSARRASAAPAAT
jgi:hypothetical protein